MSASPLSRFTTTPNMASVRDLLWGPWGISLLAIALVAVFDTGNFGPFVTSALSSLLHTLPYIIFAVFLLAYLKTAGADAIIARAFEGQENRMIVFAALFGGLAPFCSCEVIPFIAGLLALGAPLSAIMAFWLASPLIDPPSLMITAGALGWNFAIGKAIFAIAIGLFGGYAMKGLMRTGLYDNPLRPNPTNSGSSCCSSGPKTTDKPVWRIWEHGDKREKFAHEYIDNFMFLLKWLALAYVLESALKMYVPAAWIASLVGGEGILAVILAALLGLPAYLNGYAAPALLSGLIDQGMGQGPAMAFLTSGAVTCIAAMAAVWSLVKLPVFLTYIGLGLVGAVIAGFVFQMFV